MRAHTRQAPSADAMRQTMSPAVPSGRSPSPKAMKKTIVSFAFSDIPLNLFSMHSRINDALHHLRVQHAVKGKRVLEGGGICHDLFEVGKVFRRRVEDEHRDAIVARLVLDNGSSAAWGFSVVKRHIEGAGFNGVYVGSTFLFKVCVCVGRSSLESAALSAIRGAKGSSSFTCACFWL